MIRRTAFAVMTLWLAAATPALAEPPGDPTAAVPLFEVAQPSDVAPAETPSVLLEPAQGFSGDLAAIIADPTVASRLAGLGLDATLLQSFYAEREDQALWVQDSGIAPTGFGLLQALGTAADGGLATIRQAVLRARLLHGATDPASLGELELLLTGTLAEAGYQATEAFAPRTRAEVLDAIDEEDYAGSIAALLPAQPGFWALADAYRRYSRIALDGGWGRVAEGPKLEFGMRDARVPALRQRLVATDGAAADAPEPDLFDADLQAAAERFQRRHGLGDDGVVGFKTIEAMNVPVEDRLRAIAFNLQKLFDKRRDYGDRYIYVNLAGAELTYVDHGVVQTHIRTVVGRTDRPSPELDSEINRLEFNPYWTVPPKIARVDLLPKVQSNPGFFAEHNIRVYTSWSEDANEVDPASIDWFSAEAKAMRYRLKQDPGPENALGPVKLLFPNKYDVYIHGTTHQELFAKPARFFSSGCVRVKEPLDLAAMVLSDDPAWDRARIDATVAGGKNTSVMLQRPLPVHLDYRTVWVDAGGLLQIRDDIYGRDKLPATVAIADAALRVK